MIVKNACNHKTVHCAPASKWRQCTATQLAQQHAIMTDNGFPLGLTSAYNQVCCLTCTLLLHPGPSA